MSYKIYTFFLTLSCLVQCSAVCCQSVPNKSMVDSIERVYERAYQADLDNNIPLATKLSEQCMEMSKKANYKKGILKAKHVVADLLMLEDKKDQAIAAYTTLIGEAKRQGFNDVAAAASFELGSLYYNMSNPDKARPALDQAAYLNCGKDSLLLMGDILNCMALNSESQDSIANTIKYYVESYKIYKSAERIDKQAKVLNNLTGTLYENGFYKLAEHYGLEAVAVAGKGTSFRQIGFSLVQMTAIEIIQQKWDRVQYYLAQELSFIGEHHELDMIAYRIDYQHGVYLMHVDSINEAIQKLEVSFLGSIKDDGFNINVGCELGFDYLMINDIAKSRATLAILQEKANHIKNPNKPSASFFEKSSLQNVDALSTAIFYCSNSAYDRVHVSRLKEQLLYQPYLVLSRQGINKLSEIYGLEEDYVKADYLVLQERYKYQQREIELKQQRVKILTIGGTIGLLLITILSLLYFRNRSLVKKLNTSHATLDQKNKYLQLYDRAISHDLASPMALINDCAKTLHDKEQLTPELTDMLLESIYKESDILLKHIRALYHIGIDDSYDASLDKASVPKVLQQAAHLAGLDPKQVSFIGMQDIPNIFINENGLMLIFQNLFANAKKHGGNGDSLRIKINANYATSGHKCTISVADNGKGIPKPVLANIFDLGYSTGSSSGLGLFMSRSIVEKYGGTISCYSKEGSGTTFVLELNTAGKKALVA